MSKGEIIISILSIVLSGVVATLVTNIYNTCQTNRNRKIQVIEDFFAYKFQIDMKDISKKEINQVINKINLVFYNDIEVIKAREELQVAVTRLGSKNVQIDNLINDKLITLLKAMCKSAHINCNNRNNSYFADILSFPYTDTSIMMLNVDKNKDRKE